MAGLGFPVNSSLNLRGGNGGESAEAKLADKVWSESIFSPQKTNKTKQKTSLPAQNQPASCQSHSLFSLGTTAGPHFPDSLAVCHSHVGIAANGTWVEATAPFPEPKRKEPGSPVTTGRGAAYPAASLILDFTWQRNNLQLCLSHGYVC